jgi:hypothetical protein
MKMKYFYLALSAIVFFASCNKKPDPSPSSEDILRKGNWRLASGKLTVNKPNGMDTTLNYMNFIPECYKDDYIRFDSLNYGRRYFGATACSPADPTFVSFIWQLKGNGNVVDLLSGFNNLYAVVDTIQPYHFDTLQKDPLVLDTILGVLDTLPGQTKILIVLDTVRELRFSGIPLGTSIAGTPIGGFDIYNAEITNFSQASFTLNFSIRSLYPDSTNYHAGLPNNELPIMRPDTIHYSLIYNNF